MKMLSTGICLGLAVGIASLAPLRAQAPTAPDAPPATPPAVPFSPVPVPDNEVKANESQSNAAPAAPAPPAASDPLAAVETAYAENRAAALRRVLARYADELETLAQTLAANGDAAGAARARMERDQVLPALGLPAVADEDASEFAAFEDGPDAAAPPPAALSGDLESMVKNLQSGKPAAAADAPRPEPAATAATPGAGAGGPVKGVRRVLRMTNAELPGKTYDPLYGHYAWTFAGQARWTLNDLPPGNYQLLLRYSCDEKDGGGRIGAEFGAGKAEADVLPTGSWKRRREMVLGPFEVTGNRAEVFLKVKSVKPGALYVMDLNALVVQPVPAGKNPDKP